MHKDLVSGRDHMADCLFALGASAALHQGDQMPRTPGHRGRVLNHNGSTGLDALAHVRARPGRERFGRTPHLMQVSGTHAGRAAHELLCCRLSQLARHAAAGTELIE